MSEDIQAATLAKVDSSLLELDVPVLDSVVEHHQTWDVLCEKWNVTNPVPPWKSSLDGMCDALDEGACNPDAPNKMTFEERRNEEDALSQGRYSDLPYPENQLVALAHSLVARGLVDPAELEKHMDSVRTRLES